MYSVCRKQYPELCGAFAFDEISPSAEAVVARTAESTRISVLCTVANSPKPVILEGANEAEMRTHLMRLKLWKIQEDEKIKFKNAFNSCLACITSKISSEVLVMILHDEAFKVAEKDYNIGVCWARIKELMTPKGNSLHAIVAVLHAELASMRMQADEEINGYSIRYGKKREELLGYGDFWVKEDIDGMLFTMSLNNAYADFKNFVCNNDTIKGFSKVKELVLQWKLAAERKSKEEVIAAAAATGPTRPKRRCLHCNAEGHLIRDCRKYKQLKGKDTKVVAAGVQEYQMDGDDRSKKGSP